MRSPLRPLLPVLLLCSPMAAHADNVLTGDYWLLLQQGELNNNVAFVADAEPTHIVQRKGGVQSLGVYQLYERAGAKTLTSYDVEVDCRKDRVRIVDADDFNNIMGSFSPAKFAPAWQTKPEPWLAQARSFLCRPAERETKQMIALGTMSIHQLISGAITMFQVRGRQQGIDMMLKLIDKEFDKMPMPPKEGIQ